MHASLPGSTAAMAPVTELRPSGVSPDRIRWPTMNDEPDKREGKKHKQDPRKDPRQDRLKLALRENLKRRKSQARGRSDVTVESTDNVDVSLDNERGKKPGE